MSANRNPFSTFARFLGALACILAGAIAGSSPVLAVGDYVGFEPAPWMQSLDGTAAIDGNSLAGTSFDFEDTLGLDADDTSPTGRLWFRLGKNRLILDVADSSRDGQSVLTQDLTFNDTTYSASENVATDLDMLLLQAKYRYSFVDLKVVRLDLGVGVNLAQIDMQMDGSTSGLTTFDEDVPFPTINAAFIIKAAPGFRIRTEADVMSVSVSGNDVDIFDARLQAEYYFAHFIGLFAGYRTYNFDVEADDFGLVDAEFDGFYAGLGVKF